MGAIRAFWTARNPRERSVLLSGAAGTALLLLYAFVWEPVRAEHARLRQSLPETRLQATQFAADAAAAERLLKGRSGARAAEGGTGAIESAAERAGIRASVKSIDEVPGGRLRVVIEPVPYEALVRLIGDVSGSAALTVDALQLGRGTEAGTVQVTSLVFRGGGGS